MSGGGTEPVQFFERLPDELHTSVMALRQTPGRKRPDRISLEVKALAYGLDLARRAQRWEKADVDRYSGSSLHSVRFTVPADLLKEIEEVAARHDLHRRLVTITALHYGFTDPLSPVAAYSGRSKRHAS